MQSSRGDIAYFNFGLDLLGLAYSPSVQPNRLACIDEGTSIAVAGSTLALLDLNCADIDPGAVEGTPDNGNVVKHSFASPLIRESIAVPQVSPGSSLQGCCRVTSGLAYAVDSRANVVVARAGGAGGWSCSHVGAGNVPFSDGFSAIAAIDSASAVTCHYLSRRLQWTDVAGGVSARGTSALFNPTAIAAIGGNGPAAGSVAVTEGRCISIWDHRMKENGMRQLHLLIACCLCIILFSCTNNISFKNNKRHLLCSDGCSFRSSSGPSSLWTVLSKCVVCVTVFCTPLLIDLTVSNTRLCYII
jgi:hypothetical protein